jgi:hypothetical protein
MEGIQLGRSRSKMDDRIMYSSISESHTSIGISVLLGDHQLRIRILIVGVK